MKNPSNKLKLIFINVLGLLIGFFVVTFSSYHKGAYVEEVYAKSSEMVKPVLEEQQKDETVFVKTGFVSYYTVVGCLGCNARRITASGEILDDSKLTLAIPASWRKEIPMGTMVKLTNLDNGKEVIAKANDTGGFLKYDRIADLSLATCMAIDCKTDKSNIKLEVLK